MASEATPIAPEDVALLERVAGRIIDLHLEIPAILTLETGKPVSLLASQAMIFFEPLVAAMLRLPDYRRFALLIERRDVLELLLREIETRADEAHARRRADSEARRAARRQPH